jgi:hypothetical protein
MAWAGARRPPRRGSVLRRLLTLASLTLLTLSPALPLLNLADGDGPYCCRRGRCCCAPNKAPTSGPCLRVACGCERGEGPLAPVSPVRVAAILPIAVTLCPDRRAGLAPAARDSRAPAPAPEPPEHPPRRLDS